MLIVGILFLVDFLKNVVLCGITFSRFAHQKKTVPLWPATVFFLPACSSISLPAQAFVKGSSLSNCCEKVSRPQDKYAPA